MEAFKLPALYKKTNTGAIQFWRQRVETDDNGNVFIRAKYGLVGTNAVQESCDEIKVGKNVGRSNETNRYEQAVVTAESRWEKKVKKGYVRSIADAAKGEVDASRIKGGISPMLAKTWQKHRKNMEYPCYVQPKLDGVRCIAILENGECTLWTRTRKPITTMDHIVKDIQDDLPAEGKWILDGELYNHHMRDEFEEIISRVKREEKHKDAERIQYHVYDIVSNAVFVDRLKELENLQLEYMHLKMVDTVICYNSEEVLSAYENFLGQGYEGAMVRSADGLYVQKRTPDLLKYKEFKEDEFRIVGIHEGRGKLTGHVGSFECELSNGKTFSAKANGALSNLKKYWDNPKLWKGKKLTVQYQNLTLDGIPRFPVGKAIRDYE